MLGLVREGAARVAVRAALLLCDNRNHHSPFRKCQCLPREGMDKGGYAEEASLCTGSCCAPCQGRPQVPHANLSSRPQVIMGNINLLPNGEHRPRRVLGSTARVVSFVASTGHSKYLTLVIYLSRAGCEAVRPGVVHLFPGRFHALHTRKHGTKSSSVG